MNKLLISAVLAFISAAVLLSSAVAQTPKASQSPSSSVEEFFIVSAVDLTKSQLLLKRPTEVTVLMKTGESIRIVDENGKDLKLASLRAGDTVWVRSTASGSDRLAQSIRKGPMTPADLRRLYLHPPTQR